MPRSAKNRFNHILNTILQPIRIKIASQGCSPDRDFSIWRIRCQTRHLCKNAPRAYALPYEGQRTSRTRTYALPPVGTVSEQTRAYALPPVGTASEQARKYALPPENKRAGRTRTPVHFAGTLVPKLCICPFQAPYCRSGSGTAPPSPPLEARLSASSHGSASSPPDPLCAFPSSSRAARQEGVIRTRF